MRRAFVLAAAGASVFALLAPPAEGKGDALVIRHETRGCHSWSLNGSPYRARQLLRIGRIPPHALTVINGDLRPHRLLQLSGPRVRLRPWPRRPARLAGRMEPGAQVALDFRERGVYQFTTRPEGRSPRETAGPDTVLTLTVVVS